MKFVDFQLSSVGSPMRDLFLFLTSSLKLEVLEENFDDLINFYYENFISCVESLKLDTSKFSRDSFDEQMKKDANDEFFHCLMLIKLFTAEVSNTDVFDLDSVLNSKTSKVFIDRMRVVVSKFAKSGWL